MHANITTRQAINQDLDNLAELFNAYRIFYQKDNDLTLSKNFLATRL